MAVDPTPAVSSVKSKLVAFINAELENPAVNTASRALLAAVVTVALAALGVHVNL